MKIVCFAAAAAILLGACGNRHKSNATDSSQTDSVALNAESRHAGVESGIIDEEAVINEGFRSKKGLPMIVDFSAVWCGPCRQFKPVFHETAEEFAGKAEFLAIDVDTYPKLAEKYGVEAIPTVIYFDASGKEVARTQGFLGKDEFRAAVYRLVE